MNKLLSLLSITLTIFAFLFTAPSQAVERFQSPTASLQVIDRDGRPVEQIVDGDQISLRVELAEALHDPVTVKFLLDGELIEAAKCEILVGEKACQTEMFPSLGWHWLPNGEPRPKATLTATVGSPRDVTGQVSVVARPVVLVHGLNSDWRAWTNYLGPNGYLAGIGLQGFAVGDGQFPGVLNTGSLADPTKRTNTIAQNAKILGDYIDAVRKETGAQQVDLVGHSMGGLISRYYLDKYMEEDKVAQLIMLGTPMAGSACANLPASLGILIPAVFEIRPSYVKDIFNQQITHRRGVPFYMLAGTQIVKALQSPCTDVPTDIVVSVSSATAIPLHARDLPLLHTALNTSRIVFDDFVSPLLRSPAGKIPEESDPPLSSSDDHTEQFTRVYSGKIEPGESQEIVIAIEPGVSVASFALFDTTRSLQVRVTGASGKEIVLDEEKNGLIEIDDPSTLVYLGYGFENPKPGNWRVTLLSSERTPPEGAHYAISARFSGGARLSADTDILLPQVNESVRLSAQFEMSAQSISVSEMRAVIQGPAGDAQVFPLQAGQDGVYALVWAPDQPGLYGIEVQGRGRLADGMEIDRAAFLVIEAQPVPSAESYPGRVILAWVLAIGVPLLLMIAALVAWRLVRLSRDK